MGSSWKVTVWSERGEIWGKIVTFGTDGWEIGRAQVRTSVGFEKAVTRREL